MVNGYRTEKYYTLQLSLLKLTFFGSIESLKTLNYEKCFLLITIIFSKISEHLYSPKELRMTNFEIAITRISEAKEKGSRYLDLSGLGLSSIPEQISELWNLCELDLSFNNFTEFPSVIIGMTNISSLNLNHNYLHDLPFTFGLYYSLKELDISYNSFGTIPDELSYLRELETIIYDRNPFHDRLPLEIKENDDIFYIKFYLDSLKPSIEPKKLFETKLLIIGKGEVGKTTLMKVIKNPKTKVKVGKEETTHGINIAGYNEDLFFPAIDPYYDWRFDYGELFYDEEESGAYSDRKKFTNVEDNEELIEEIYDELNRSIRSFPEPYDNINEKFFVKKRVKVNIWDFGGQEILYSTHQFFLTQRSIYVLVWEPRSDSYEENFDYWLNVIKRLGKDSPVIVVMNKSDISVKNIDERRYQNEFKNILGFHRISCVTKEGVKRFMNMLMYGVTGLKHMGDPLPAIWDHVRTVLKDRAADYISFTEFKNICNVEDDKEAIYIASYLSDLGDIIYFDNDMNLHNLVITNPHWLTKAIYELIHSLEVQKNDGLLEADNLSSLLDRRKYPKDKHLEILSLMERFEICFRVVGAKNLYVIPALLRASPDDAKLITKFETPEALKYHVTYDHMPSGIIERLICRLNKYLDGSNYWKYGAVFHTEHSRALVYIHTAKRKIFMYVDGSLKTEIYTLIQSAIKEINEDLKLKPGDSKEFIACICSECSVSNAPYMFEYDILSKYLVKSKETIDCRESTDSVNIRELLSGYRKTGMENNNILREVVLAASILQSRHKTFEGGHEDRINLYFQDLLRPIISSKGFFTSEQSLRGSSESRKQIGELDINIETIDGKSITFFEGFILRSLNKTVIDKHIRKSVLNYDSNGLKEKFTIVYCYAENYIDLFQKYQKYANTIDIESIEFIEIEDLSKIYVNGSEIKVLRSKYIRNNSRLVLYHLLINLNL